MGTTTTVSRRMVKMKVHKTNKPHVPLPRRSSVPSDDDTMVGDEAKAIVMKAIVRQAPPQTWWQKAIKPTGIAAGVLACAGFGYFVLNAPDRPTYSRAEPTVVAAAPVTRSRTRDPGSAYPGAPTTEPIVLSNRSTPTDQSFQATAYVRKKVYLPDIEGDCVVKSGLDRVVASCLRESSNR